MTINYGKLFSRKTTPQSEAIPGSAQVPNSAGGFAWAVDKEPYGAQVDANGLIVVVAEENFERQDAGFVRRALAELVLIALLRNIGLHGDGYALVRITRRQGSGIRLRPESQAAANCR